MTAPTVNKRVPTRRHTNPPSLRLSLVRSLVPQVEKVRPGLKGIVGFVAGGGPRNKLLLREGAFPHNRAGPGGIHEAEKNSAAPDRSLLNNVIHLDLALLSG